MLGLGIPTYSSARGLGHRRLFNTFESVFARAGIPFDYSVVGIAFTLAGLYLACMLPAVNLPLGKLPTLYCFGRAEPFY